MKLTAPIPKVYSELSSLYHSPKAELFKQWLAKIAKKRIEDIENPELDMDRVKNIYEKKAMIKLGLINACEELLFAKI